MKQVVIKELLRSIEDQGQLDTLTTIGLPKDKLYELIHGILKSVEVASNPADIVKDVPDDQKEQLLRESLEASLGEDSTVARLLVLLTMNLLKG